MADDYYTKHKNDPVFRAAKRARDNAYYDKRKGRARKSGVRIPEEQLLEKALKIYGAACACCDESEKMFLTVVKKDGSPMNLKTAVAEPNCGIYETSCFNCVMGRLRTGSVCPHNLDKALWEDKDKRIVSKVSPDSLDRWCQ